MCTRSTWAVSVAAVLVSTMAVGAALTTATATATRSVSQANSATFQDSTGEDPNALDIGTVTVSNDDSGLVTFDVKFVNGSISAVTDRFFVVLDSDRDESTGEPDSSGADWFIGWKGTPALLKWDGNDFVLAPSMKTLVTMVQPNGIVIKINRSELGGVGGFDFYVKTYRPNPSDPEGEYSDWAPEWNLWSYDIKVYVPPVLTAGAVTCTPDPPRAGRSMVARLSVTVTRGGAAEPLGAAARVKATAVIGGRTFTGAVLPRSAKGRIAARWLVPKTAKGKAMRGTITVSLEKVSVTRTFVDRVE